MGKFLSKIMDALSSLSESSPARILMLGLDAAGKTTILYKLKLNESINTIPTIGFNVETISPVKGVTFTVWDVGGQEKLRQLWKHYYENTQGLLFVVDSADRVRMPEACEELHGILMTPNMAGVPVVVFANKQDLPGAMAISEVADALHLDQLKDRKWYVHGTCATVGEGIHEGIVELSTYVKEFKKRGYRPF